MILHSAGIIDLRRNQRSLLTWLEDFDRKLDEQSSSNESCRLQISDEQLESVSSIAQSESRLLDAKLKEYQEAVSTKLDRLQAVHLESNNALSTDVLAAMQFQHQQNREHQVQSMRMLETTACILQSIESMPVRSPALAKEQDSQVVIRDTERSSMIIEFKDISETGRNFLITLLRIANSFLKYELHAQRLSRKSLLTVVD